MSLPVVRDHTDAVVVALEQAGLTVGDGRAPDTAPPYATVYAVPSAGGEGSLDDQDEDAVLVYQVTCIGVSRKQAEWVYDKAAAALLQGTLQVEDRRILRVVREAFGGVQRDDDAQPPLFYSVPRFRLWTVPA